MDGGDVMLIINHIDKRIGETEARLMTVIREGRVAHTREHEAQQAACQHAMGPLQEDFQDRQRAEVRRDARVGPLVRGATWVTNHWPVSLAGLAALLWLLTQIGVLRP